MMHVVLLCCVLLSPVAAFPRNVQNDALTFQPSSPDPRTQPNMLSSQVPLLDAKICQDLLYKALSLGPLPEYLSNVALSVAMGEVGCPTEAHLLQLQEFSMEGKDTIETLIHEIQKLSEEEGIDNAELLLKHLQGSLGELRRDQRSADLPEACTHEHGRILYDTAVLVVEVAEKLPATELITELKTSAINFTQSCTDEAWKHMEAVGNRLMKSPEIKNFAIFIKDKVYFFVRSIVLLKRALMEMVQNVFQTYFT
ncbi:PREDICTED: apolipoprotein F-like [Chrysochloris asiatica]|uniref:Apolipoprotein F-like n=1 Tax=Chrysochloris asiatica TaxID=185453 RepID=A0A9B0TDM8_CHRAS|nr:PREDICTED: apolipoprotein F-like [Chrysochloris asiatica]